MILVQEITSGLFAVFIDEECEKDLSMVADHTDDSSSAVIRAILITAISVLVKDVLDERTQDGLEGKNEGMGRR